MTEQVSIQERLKAAKEGNSSAPQKQQKIRETKVQEVPISNAQEKLYNVFWHTSVSCKVTTDTGRTISFVGGKYITDSKEEIEYLNREIALGNPYLYTKKGEEQLTSDELDPMKVLKKKHIEEYLAEEAKKKADLAAGITKDGGSTEQQKLTPGSTTDIADMASGSDSAGQ